MRRAWIIVFLLALTMCKQETSIVDNTKRNNISVMSTNIAFTDDHMNDEFSWPNRSAAYYAMFEEISPDVVGMQEATPKYNDDEEKGRPNQSKDLINRFPEYETYRLYPTDIVDPVTSLRCGSRHGGVMIMYKREKFNLLDKGIFWLSETPDTPLGSEDIFGATFTLSSACIWARLQEKESQKDFYFFTTHLPYDPDVRDKDNKRIYNVIPRLRCAELIVSRIKSIAGGNAIVFLTGDMNAAYENTTIHTYNGESHAVCESLAPFDYLWQARTEAPITDDYDSNNRFDDSKTTQKIDHISYRNAKPLKFRTINKPYLGVKYYSDHWPLVCDFEL